jgi:hypothetical protein
VQKRFGDEEAVSPAYLFTAPSFTYTNDLEAYLTAYEAATHYLIEQAAREKDRATNGPRQAIQEFWQWQQSLPAEWREHFQAHTCEKCKHYAPLLAEQGDPPCHLVVDQLRMKRYGGEKIVAPDFGCLVAESGQLAPRCEAFAYRELPGFAFPDYMDIALPRGDRMLFWIEAIVARARSSYSNHVLWGALSWLDYGRTIGHSETDWKPLSRWISVHWDEIGDGCLAHLVDVIISETRLMTSTGKHAVELLDADSMNRERWRRLRFPFSEYRKYAYMISNWPDDWPKPWESTTDDGNGRSEVVE